jgi:hypothetical protein
MRDVRDNLDLAQLKEAKQGYIANLRTDMKKLHRAWCESVGAMYPGAYRKVFFEDRDEARRWLDTEYTSARWDSCGKCFPLSN